MVKPFKNGVKTSVAGYCTTLDFDSIMNRTHYESIIVTWANFLFISFQQKNEIKKGKYPDGVTCCSIVDLPDVKDFKRNMADCNLIRKHVAKRFRCCSFHVKRNFPREWFLSG